MAYSPKRHPVAPVRTHRSILHVCRMRPGLSVFTRVLGNLKLGIVDPTQMHLCVAIDPILHPPPCRSAHLAGHAPWPGRPPPPPSAPPCPAWQRVAGSLARTATETTTVGPGLGGGAGRRGRGSRGSAARAPTARWEGASTGKRPPPRAPATTRALGSPAHRIRRVRSLDRVGYPGG